MAAGALALSGCATTSPLFESSLTGRASLRPTPETPETTPITRRDDTEISAAVRSRVEADALTCAGLRERANEFITGKYDFKTGKGEIIGLPDLRPGDNINLSGLGKRFSGVYYVSKVEHVLGAGGYSTQFEVRRSSD